MPALMTDATNGHRPAERAVRIAAAGDIHCHEGNREETAAAFATLEERADIVLLAGDLSTHGEAEQAEVLADAVRDVDLPIFAVLGNHDWHVNRPHEFIPVLEDAGITVLERSWATPCVNGVVDRYLLELRRPPAGTRCAGVVPAPFGVGKRQRPVKSGGWAAPVVPPTADG